MAPDRFDLDDLLRGAAEPGSPGLAQHALVKKLMEIDYRPGREEKVAQLDERIETLRALEARLQTLIVTDPDLRDKPPASCSAALGSPGVHGADSGEDRDRETQRDPCRSCPAVHVRPPAIQLGHEPFSLLS